METVKHIKNYHKIRKMIEAYFDTEIRKAEERLATFKDLLARVRAGEKGPKLPGSEYDATEKNCIQQISYIEDYLRPPYRGKPRNGTYLRWRQDALDRLDRADRAPKFTGLKVKIEWKCSRTWGHNPAAECWVFGEGGEGYPLLDGEGKVTMDPTGSPIMMQTHYKTGHASGYGYDKRSAAIQEGLACPTMDRLIIENEKSWTFYAIDGKDYLPHLSISGKGTETLCQLFHQYSGKPPIPGFKWSWEEGRTWDLIEVTHER